MVVKKHSNTALKTDIILGDSDDDKKLITGEVLSKEGKYPEGTTVIFGKYAVLKLVIAGEDFYLLDEEDVLGTADYKE